ncbi:MAG: hemerythrin family protein [Magnetococcales bacterium]|nr:hemerythrin family protein [Magnetococcales bacterium]
MSTTKKHIPETLILGNDSIDSEHDVLFSLFDKIQNALDNSNYMFDFEEIIGELVSYVSFHFKNEEKLMTKLGYPNQLWHKKQHNLMKAHVHGYLYRFKSDKESQKNIAIDINDFIKTWLINHIAKEDMTFANYMK